MLTFRRQNSIEKHELELHVPKRRKNLFECCSKKKSLFEFTLTKIELISAQYELGGGGGGRCVMRAQFETGRLEDYHSYNYSLIRDTRAVVAGIRGDCNERTAGVVRI
jgi:hypothetical protein